MEDLFVQWKNYHELSIMEMRRTGDFCDVTLMCKYGDVQAHQMVLFTGSEVFSRMLREGLKETEDSVTFSALGGGRSDVALLR